MGRDESYMRLALDLAKRSADAGEVPIGAVVVVRNEVVGRGKNEPIGRCDPSAHAEIIALRQAGEHLGNYRLAGATLYATVEPCLMCLGAALHARIDRLVFGAEDPKLASTRQLERLRSLGAAFNHRFEVTGGILADECARLLTGFFTEKRISENGEVPKWS